MNNSNTTYVGLSVPGLLGVVFITLKLLGVINWSWWWVMAPFWIPTGIGIIFVFICGTMVAIAKRKNGQ